MVNTHQKLPTYVQLRTLNVIGVLINKVNSSFKWTSALFVIMS